MSGRQTYRARCAHDGCAEVAYFDRMTAAERDRLAQQFQRRPWHCTRHRNPEEVISPTNPTRTITLHAERSRRFPDLTKLFWREGDAADVGSGFMGGPGFKASADDFPEGARLTITVVLDAPHPTTTERPAAEAVGESEEHDG